MHKLIKTKITGFDNIENSPLGVNSNYRTTMGYDSSSETINVKVEKLIRPDLTRDESPEITYQIVDEKSFVKSDFAQTQDCMAWQVDFDIKAEKILSPLDVYAFTSTIANGSSFHRVMWRKIKERYSSDTLVPLFTLDSFYKNDETFSTSVLQFHIADVEGTASDTIIINDNVEEKTQAEKIEYCVTKINTHVFYEILDSDDNVISSMLNPSEYPQQALSAREVAIHSRGGNQYRVALPNASEYKIKVVFSRELSDKNISNVFNINTVNAVSNKTRITSGVKEGQTTYPGISRQNDPTVRFAGFEVIKVSASLDSGDYFKVKLSVGDFYSYSELWVDIL